MGQINQIGALANSLASKKISSNSRSALAALQPRCRERHFHRHCLRRAREWFRERLFSDRLHP